MIEEMRVTSVLQDWVMELPLRAQGTLLTGIRGADELPKLPLDSTARQLTAFLRFCVMNPADPREVGIEPGAFFQPEPPRSWRASELGHLPQHWYSHLMHCYEVVAYYHPSYWDLVGQTVSEHGATPANAPLSSEAFRAYSIYSQLVRSLHLNVERRDEMIERLTEDRIAAGTVVS